MFDANRLLNQLTGAQGGDVRVREGQEQNLGSILGQLAGGGQAGASGSGLGALLGGLTAGRTGAGSAGMGAPAAGGTAGGSSLGGAMGAGPGGSSLSGGLEGSRGGGGIGDMLSGALGPGGLLSGGAGKGALAAGLVGMLMKSGKPKKMMSSGLKLGGLALIGGLAYKAYQDYQAGQTAAAPQPAVEPPPQDSAFAPTASDEKQMHARAMIRAMVAAAKADGHVDADEQNRLFSAMDTLDLDNDDKAFLMDELRAPLDVRSVAGEARSPELAAEMYVASLLVCDEVDPQERRYLDDLAGAMNLPRELALRLEAQVNAAREG